MSTRRSTNLHLLEAPLHERGNETLVARAKQDPQAFADLYRMYVDTVYRHCAHRLGHRQAAEDATSEIFFKAMTNLRSCRDGRSFRSWLFRIAHNVITDHYRAWRPEEPIEAAATVHDRSRSPEESAIETDGQQAVHRLLARLNPKQARILELRLAGLTGQEIVQVLGGSLASVKIGQVRGYARLREIVGESDNGMDRHDTR